MYELMEPLAPVYGEVGKVFPVEPSESRFGQDGKAQLPEGLQTGDMDEAGESENFDEVVRGGDGSDFKGILIGFPPAKRGEGVKEMVEVGEGDMSVMVWSDNMMEISSEVRSLRSRYEGSQKG